MDDLERVYAVGATVYEYLVFGRAMPDEIPAPSPFGEHVAVKVVLAHELKRASWIGIARRKPLREQAALDDQKSAQRKCQPLIHRARGGRPGTPAPPFINQRQVPRH